LRFTSGENRFSFPFFDRVEEALADMEAAKGPGALVTVGEGKFYSNGIDLDWVGTSGVDLTAFIRRMHRFLARFLSFPMPTVAALNGHAFAGGGMLALSHDFRVMRTDRGYFCLPEVDIGIPFTEPLSALIRCKLTPKVALHAMTTGARYTAEQALSAAIVDAVAPEADVLPKAVEMAAQLAGKDRGTLAAIKRNAYAPELAKLEG
jgi:enoyl-CoA hydratase/carnithine racemase